MNINGPGVSVVPVSAAINLGKGEQHSLPDFFCPEFKISSDSLHSVRAPRGLVHLPYRNTDLCLNTYKWPVRSL